MASFSELQSATLSISQSKLEQVKRQRTRWEEGKGSLLHLVEIEANPVKKFEKLREGFKELTWMHSNDGKVDDVSLDLERYLSQAQYDPTISSDRIKQWMDPYLRRLNTQSECYNYALLHKSIIEEWLSQSEQPSKPADDIAANGEGASLAAQEFRAKWETNVFTAKQTDEPAIAEHLKKLFTSEPTKNNKLSGMREHITNLEKSLTEDKQINDDMLNWCVRGLLRSDLLTNEKKAVLTAIEQDKAALKDLKDDLNMRLRTLDRWTWPSKGVKAELRRQVNTQCRIFHDEKLQDSLLHRYIGVKFSVQFYSGLTAFSTDGTWYNSWKPMSPQEKQRWQYCHGNYPTDANVRKLRKQTLEYDYFLSQLLLGENELDRGYDAGDQEADRKAGMVLRKPAGDTKEEFLCLVQTEIIVGE